jgi:hypothetical protein
MLTKASLCEGVAVKKRSWLGLSLSTPSSPDSAIERRERDTRVPGTLQFGNTVASVRPVRK